MCRLHSQLRAHRFPIHFRSIIDKVIHRYGFRHSSDFGPFAKHFPSCMKFYEGDDFLKILFIRWGKAQLLNEPMDECGHWNIRSVENVGLIEGLNLFLAFGIVLASFLSFIFEFQSLAEEFLLEVGANCLSLCVDAVIGKNVIDSSYSVLEKYRFL